MTEIKEFAPWIVGPGLAFFCLGSYGHDSIRAIERVFSTNDNKMKSLGLGPVRKSTLADANKSRSIEVLEELFQFCVGKVYEVAPTKIGFRFKGEVFAFDSTTIELCLRLCPWAQFNHNKGVCQLHAAIDVANDLPSVLRYHRRSC